MEPEAENWSRELERFRPFLSMLARQIVNPRLWKDVDPSGVVQDTMVEALQNRNQFRGDGPAALESWLRRIHFNNLKDAIRKVHRDMRDVDRQVSLAAAFDETTSHLEATLKVGSPSPATLAVKNEALLRLARALEKLESPQREAVEFHHLQGRPLKEVALLLGRSQSAAAALLNRGLMKLKELMKRDDP